MKGSYLEIHTSTWDKETHNLFDYETKSVQKSSFKITSGCCLYRSKLDCYISGSEIIEGSTPLLTIEEKSSEFQVNLLGEEAGEKMCLVVKGLSSQRISGYRLSEGD